WQEANALEIEAEAIDGLHAEGAVLALVVFILDPTGEGAIERFEARQVELTGQETHSDGAKKSFDLSLRSPAAHRRMTEDSADALTDQRDFVRRVIAAVVDVEALAQAALVQGALEGPEQRLGVVSEEEFAMAAYSAASDRAFRRYPIRIPLIRS